MLTDLTPDRATGARRATVAILVGLQASGKTTFYQQVLAGTHAHVSKDNFPNTRHRQQRQLRLVDTALRDGRNVAVDNTNPSPEEWRPLVEVARAHGAEVAGYWFEPDLAGSLERNALRQGRRRVPDVGLHSTHARLRRPQLADGFDRLYNVRFDGLGGFVSEPLVEHPPTGRS